MGEWVKKRVGSGLVKILRPVWKPFTKMIIEKLFFRTNNLSNLVYSLYFCSYHSIASIESFIFSLSSLV